MANHTFTAVGRHGAYCFGGQGKRTFNSVHSLDPVTLAWEEVKTLGVGLCRSKATSPLLASLRQDTEQTMAENAATCPVSQVACKSSLSVQRLPELSFPGACWPDQSQAPAWSLCREHTLSTPATDPCPHMRAGASQVPSSTWRRWCSRLPTSDLGLMARTHSCLQSAPEPRHGHSTIWDESDSLIVFGGAHGTHCLADVHVLSLSTGFWSRRTCRGTAPTPRSNHSAALISPTLMLVFGGCTAAGAFMNDVHILDIATFTWHQPGVVGPAPAARYGHACQVLDGRVVILGGSNAAKAFDGVLTVCTDFGRWVMSRCEGGILCRLPQVDCFEVCAGLELQHMLGGLFQKKLVHLSASAVPAAVSCVSSAHSASDLTGVSLSWLTLSGLALQRAEHCGRRAGRDDGSAPAAAAAAWSCQASCASIVQQPLRWAGPGAWRQPQCGGACAAGCPAAAAACAGAAGVCCQEG